MSSPTLLTVCVWKEVNISLASPSLMNVIHDTRVLKRNSWNILIKYSPCQLSSKVLTFMLSYILDELWKLKCFFLTILPTLPLNWVKVIQNSMKVWISTPFSVWKMWTEEKNTGKIDWEFFYVRSMQIFFSQNLRKS